MKIPQKLKWYVIAIFCLIPRMIFAQEISVTGTVLEETDEPMMGVTVIEKGRTKGKINDFVGTFT